MKSNQIAKAELNQVAEKTNQSEDLFRTLVQSSYDIILILDKDGIYQYASPSVEKVLGQRPEELVGKSALEKIHPDDFPSLMNAMSQIMQQPNSSLTAEYRYIRPDGTIIFLEGIGRNLLDNPVVKGLVINTRDITERKSMEEALRKSEEHYRLLAENSTDVIFTLDMNFKFTYYNPAVFNMLGYTPEEAMAQSHEQILAPESLKLAIQTYAEDIEQVKSAGSDLRRTRTLELEQIRKDGTKIWTATTSRFIYGRDQSPIGLIGVTRDISERKRAEHQLGERIKEMRAFFSIAEITAREGYTLDGLYQEMTDILPQSWQYPEVACARIVVGDSEFRTKNFMESAWKQSSLIKVKGSVVGTIDVGYLEEKPKEDDGPFLKEERQLIDAIAVRLGRITEHKQAEENLDILNQKNELILHSAAEGILGLDLQGNHTFVNPAAARMLGYEAGELLGHPSHSAWHHTKPDGSPYPNEECEIYTTLRDGAVHRSSSEVFWRKDGTSFPVVYASTPIYENGRLKGAVITFTDNTERKQAEDALRESEERYATLFRNAAEGILIADMETKKFVYANPSICRMLDYSEEEMKRLSVLDIHPAESLEHVLGEFEAQALGKRPLPVEIPCRRKDGSVIYTDITASGMTLNKRQFNVGFFSDITERKHTEKTLGESEELFRSLFESSHDAIMTIEPPTWAFTSGNQATVEMFRAKDEAEFTSHGPWDLSPEKQPDGRLSTEKAKEMIETVMRESSHFFEWTHRRITGEDFPANVLLTRVEKSGKQFIQATVRDITELKAAEQEKQKLLLGMAQMEKMSSLGQFSAGMAHEINNPLAYVKANLKVLDEYRDNLQEILQAYEQLDKRFSGAELPENVRRFHNEITALRKKLKVSEILDDSRDLIAESQGGVDRIKNIVKSLQRFSDPPKMEPEWEDINSIMEHTLNLVGSEVLRKAALIKDFGELPRVKCYAEELSQVFISLVSNALNAIKTQGEITIRTYSKGDIVVVKVKDNGIGITPDQLPKIFDPFYSTQGVGKSTGLGLSISYGIVKKHGGEIKVESEPGKGSTFTIELPVGK